MPELHAAARLLVLGMLAGTLLTLGTLPGVVAVYALIGGAMVSAGLIRTHVEFICIATMPMLAALLLVWAVVIGHSPDGQNGALYAIIIWARIVAIGGLFQWFFLPLARSPNNLRHFIDTLGASPAASALLVGPLVFLPEVQRRLARIVDARKAQGHRVDGIAGVAALPTLLAPLVASLLESAMTRAELWEHRGFLNRRPPSKRADSFWSSLVAVTVTAAVTALAIVINAKWI